MKRLILLLLVFVSLVGGAQSVVQRLSSNTTGRDSVPVPQHMKFMGIPIDGTLTSFTKELKKKGLKHIETFDREQIKFFVGNFAGYTDCLVYAIAASPEGSRVVGVVVTFAPDEKWSGLASQYETLKRRLTSKYGKPATCVERFQTYVQPNDDFMRMQYLKSDKCEYKCVFETEEGMIALEISHKDWDFGDFNNVSLTYIDRANGVAMDQDAIDDL